MAEQTLQGVAAIITRVTAHLPEAVVPTATVAQLDLDSLALVEVIAKAELDFGVMIPDEVVMKFRTVGDIVAFIDSVRLRQGARHRPGARTDGRRWPVDRRRAR